MATEALPLLAPLVLESHHRAYFAMPVLKNVWLRYGGTKCPPLFKLNQLDLGNLTQITYHPKRIIWASPARRSRLRRLSTVSQG